jgi:recombinase, phage recT family|nr:MAG TPA: RecT protein [Caudoviricetes sp.]
MASVTGGGLTIKQGAVKTAESQKAVTIQGLVAQEDIKARFEELLGKKAPGFISSLLAVVNNNKLLAKANPRTVIAAGAMAASLDLPINQNLGFAYIIPYKDEAQFQMGYKGYIQLAMRTGQYQTINAAEVYEGEILKQNRFTGEYEFGEKTSDKIVGYIAYFKLVNGFEKYLYMSIEEMQAHAKKFSKNYKGGTDKWGLTDFHSMAIKTVLKRLISKYGILSIEMQGQPIVDAITNDGGKMTIKDDGTLEADFEGDTIDIDGMTIYQDEPHTIIATEDGGTVNTETGEYMDPLFNK